MMRVLRRLRDRALRPVRNELAAAKEEAAARVAELGRALEQVDRDTRARLAAMDAVLAARAEQLSAARAENSTLHDRLFDLERLLTGTAFARPPGAVKAAAALADPAVSIIIPTRNRPEFLCEAIGSVLGQSFEKWELIIVGDGSGEATEAAVAPFLADPRIRFVWQEHSGPADARNRGIAATTAPLIAYLDDDNLWYPDFLSRAVDQLATNPEVDVLYGALVTYLHGLDRRCILWRQFNRQALVRGNYIDTNVIVHRRALVDRYGGWDRSVVQLRDWDLMLRFTADKPAFALDVLAAYYRECDDTRISSLATSGDTKAETRRRMSSGAAR